MAALFTSTALTNLSERSKSVADLLSDSSPANSSPASSSPRLVRACRNEIVDRPPVWMMRQAGRYMTEYRAIREKVSFLDLCKNTELATEVSLQPYKAFKPDGVIMFSDILIPPEAMGMEVVFGDGGPSFPNPIRHADDIERLIIPDPNEKTGFVMDLLKSLRHELKDDPETGLIGFAGSPWTLAVYMVEGGGSRHFARIKGLMYEAPEQLEKLLHKLTVTVTHYLNAQIEAGAQVVQLFDTWAGILSEDEYRRFVLPCHQQILDNLKRDKAPAILYVNNSRGLLPLMVEAKPDVISVDSLTSLAETRKIIGNDIALQGNLDPILLLGNSDVLDRRVQELLREGGNQGYIFNLGHGILPPTPPENVRLVVNRVKESAALYWDKGEENLREEKSPFAEAEQNEKPYHPSPEQEAKHKQTVEAAAGQDENKPQQGQPQQAQNAEQPAQKSENKPQEQHQAQDKKNAPESQAAPAKQEQSQPSVQPDDKAREQAPQAQTEKQPAPHQGAPEQNQASQNESVAPQQKSQEQPQAEAQKPEVSQAEQQKPQEQALQTQAEKQPAPQQNAPEQKSKEQPQANAQKPQTPQGQAHQTQVEKQPAPEQNQANQDQPAAPQQKSQEQPQQQAPQAQIEKQPAPEQEQAQKSPVDRQVEADLKAQAVQNAPDSYQPTQEQEFQAQPKQNSGDVMSVGEAESRRAQGAVEFDENAEESKPQEPTGQAESQEQPQSSQGQPARNEQAAAETLANQASSSESSSQPVERVQGVTPIEKVGPRA